MNPCAPRFLLPLSGTVEVTEGESFVLEVRVHGHPSPEVEWFKNGQELNTSYSTSPQGKLEMRINNVTQNHTGEYRCTAVNQSGRVSSAMWLAVVPKHYPRYWFATKNRVSSSKILRTIKCCRNRVNHEKLPWSSSTPTRKYAP